MANLYGTCERNIRIHQSVLESATKALLNWLRQTARIRPCPHPTTSNRLRLVTTTENQNGGQVSFSHAARAIQNLLLTDSKFLRPEPFLQIPKQPSE